MSENMTTCPECGTEMTTQSSATDLPLQTMQQECPDCAYTVQIGIVNYPGPNNFTVVAPALDGDTCRVSVDSDVPFASEQCGDPATHRIERTDQAQAEGRCIEHILGPHQQAQAGVGDD